MADNDKQPDKKQATPRALKKTESAEKKPSGPSENSVPSVIQASPKLAKIIEAIEKLSVVELADLVKSLEEKFGVSAPQVAAAPSGPAAPAGGEPSEGAPSAQTTFNIILTTAGTKKISVIKAVRELNQSLGLKEAKDLVESAPKEVLTGVNKEEADKAKKRLEEAGASVELK